MKRLFFLIVFLLIPMIVWAGPFVVCDPYLSSSPQPTIFIVVMDGGTASDSQPQLLADGSKRLHYDVGLVSAGNHTITVKACLDDPVWGRLCSSESPFSFTRPATLVVPANFGLIK